MFCKIPNVFPNTFPIATHFIPYSLPQHCPLGTYIGEEPILGHCCSYVWTSVGWFSNADPVLSVRIDWHLLMREPDWKPTSGSHMNENQLWEPFLMYICGESDRFSHRTQIRFSEFSVSFIGSSCSSSHLGLLLLWYIYLENQSGSHNIMRKPEPAGSHRKKWEPSNTGKYMNLIICLLLLIES
jgi:hypothetical protein